MKAPSTPSNTCSAVSRLAASSIAMPLRAAFVGDADDVPSSPACPDPCRMTEHIAASDSCTALNALEKEITHLASMVGTPPNVSTLSSLAVPVSPPCPCLGPSLGPRLGPSPLPGHRQHLLLGRTPAPLRAVQEARRVPSIARARRRVPTRSRCLRAVHGREPCEVPSVGMRSAFRPPVSCPGRGSGALRQLRVHRQARQEMR